ncbi:hypothetical protein QBC40DRAFT_260784 [Triangularia verruculosa]|uniref:Uncharacterized protein n=1 Tax=Triangularia verruculosa TaxID=2587418 RepID=A0AAN6XTP4_9PEZI|nr:hypothetical protein QBC40DRAFT_260784 [Triangularia verruculosa]
MDPGSILSAFEALSILVKTVVHIRDAKVEVEAAVKEINDYIENVDKLIRFVEQYHSVLEALKPTLLSDVEGTVKTAGEAIAKACVIIERNRTDSNRVSRGSPQDITRRVKWFFARKAEYQDGMEEIKRKDNNVGQSLQDLKLAVGLEEVKACIRGHSMDEKGREEEMGSQARQAKRERQARRDAEGLGLLARDYGRE